MLKAFSLGKDLQLLSFKGSSKSGDFGIAIDILGHYAYLWVLHLVMLITGWFILMEIDSMRQIWKPWHRTTAIDCTGCYSQRLCDSDPQSRWSHDVICTSESRKPRSSWFTQLSITGYMIRMDMPQIWQVAIPLGLETCPTQQRTSRQPATDIPPAPQVGFGAFADAAFCNQLGPWGHASGAGGLFEYLKYSIYLEVIQFVGVQFLKPHLVVQNSAPTSTFGPAISSRLLGPGTRTEVPGGFILAKDVNLGNLFETGWWKIFVEANHTFAGLYEWSWAILHIFGGFPNIYDGAWMISMLQMTPLHNAVGVRRLHTEHFSDEQVKSSIIPQLAVPQTLACHKDWKSHGP